MLTFLLAGLALVVTLHTYRNLAQLSFRPYKTTPAYAGHPVSYHITIDNPGTRQRHAIELQVGNQAPVVVNLPAQGAASAELWLPTHRRGKIPYCVTTVASRFPLGLFTAWSYVKLEASCLVYPKPSGASGQRLPPPLPHKEGRHTALSQGNDDFLGFRNYHPGDSSRHRHWRAVARGQPLTTKQFS
ncbi:MAG: hypothetical protein FD130_2076, partial [Halothiobacillaceae bacterium]